MLDRSPLAAYSFTDSKRVHLRVCYQDRSGNIGETFYDSTIGWNVRPDSTIGKADLNNGLAVTGWGNGTQERVYYVRQDNKIVERCYTAGKAGWYDGELTGKFTAAHYSCLAAMSYEAGGTLYIRVFYQDKDNTIRTLCRDGDKAWYQGTTFPVAFQGSSITCSYVNSSTYKGFVYFQKPDTTFVEYISTNLNDWGVGAFKSTHVYDPCAYITVATYPDINHRVFTIDRNNKLCVTEYVTGSGWAQTKELTDTIAFSPAAATLVAGSNRIRIYTQIAPGQIAEWGTDDGKNYSLMKNPLPTN